MTHVIDLGIWCHGRSCSKSQQLPHIPWSLTPVITPWSLQSTSAGKSSILMYLLGRLFVLTLLFARDKVLRWVTNSSFGKFQSKLTESPSSTILITGISGQCGQHVMWCSQHVVQGYEDGEIIDMKLEKEALITESKIFWNQGDLRKESY